MEHQVVITFDIDTTKVQENAELEAGRQIAKAVLKEVFGDTYIGSYSAKRNAIDFLTIECKQVLEDNREEIINSAIEEVVKSLSRTKMVKEKLAEAVDGKEGS